MEDRYFMLEDGTTMICQNVLKVKYTTADEMVVEFDGPGGDSNLYTFVVDKNKITYQLITKYDNEGKTH